MTGHDVRDRRNADTPGTDAGDSAARDSDAREAGARDARARKSSRVVVGVDGSEGSMHAARWAAREASSRGVPLSLVHALDVPHGAAAVLHGHDDTEQRRRDGARVLEEAESVLRGEFPDLRTETELAEPSAAHALTDLSAHAGLLVTGGRGHGGFNGMLLGSVSRRLAAHAHCPLVVVHAAQTTPALDEVVLGVEDDSSRAAIRFAFAAAERYGASLHAISSWHPRAGYYGPLGTYFGDVDLIRAEVEQAARALLDPFGPDHPGVPVKITAGRGNPVPILIDAARTARLLVVGAHRHQGPLSSGLGYVVDGVLAHSPTPVAVVPAV